MSKLHWQSGCVALKAAPSPIVLASCQAAQQPTSGRARDTRARALSTGVEPDTNTQLESTVREQHMKIDVIVTYEEASHPVVFNHLTFCLPVALIYDAQGLSCADSVTKQGTSLRHHDAETMIAWDESCRRQLWDCHCVQSTASLKMSVLWPPDMQAWAKLETQRRKSMR